MARYAAFLRGVNVGGARVIRMADLAAGFESLGFSGVRTLGASGNVAFSADGAEPAVRAAIESWAERRFKTPTEAFVRGAAELAAIARSDPFAGLRLGAGCTRYVVFLGAAAPRSLANARSKAGEVEVVLLRGREAYCVHRPKGEKLYPNAFVESALGAPATTRNWSTVLSTAAAAGLPK